MPFVKRMKKGKRKFFKKTLDKKNPLCYNIQVAEIWVWRSW